MLAIPEALYHKESPADAPVRLRYLGTAGFVIEGAQRTIVLDPFVSRPGPAATLFSPLVSDAALVRRVIPKADDVLIGHAHYDHILDGPELCRQTGARLIGSRATCNVGRAAGLPEEQLVETSGLQDIPCGLATARGLPSIHGRATFGRIPLPGDIPAPPPWPAGLRDLRHGLVLNWYVDIGGVRIVHIDSADFVNDHLAALQADVVCLCAIGRRYRAHYTEDVVRLLRPRIVVACHWDVFLLPYDATPRAVPGVDVPGFVREIEATGARAVVLPFDGVLGLHPQPRDGTVP